MTSKYSVQPHGDGFAIYQGRDHLHHGMNLGHLTETTPEIAKRIEDALNATNEPAAPSFIKMETPPSREAMEKISDMMKSCGNKGVLVAAPKALFNCENVIALTEKKTASIIADRGYNITGFVPTNDKGQKRISDESAVRWFDDHAEFFVMMHGPSSLKAVSNVVLREGNPTLLSDRDIKPTDQRLYSVDS